MLSLTRRRWLQPKPLPGAREPGDPWVAHLLEQRGVVGSSSVASYLTPSLAGLPDPGLMAGMDAAVERTTYAIRQGERIVVYGDYDVDGVCSTTVVVEGLRSFGAEIDYYIPDRREEGYGLNQDAVTALSKRAQLLITTDCGITAHEEIALAHQLGLQVIVVDHHTVPQELPGAVACLDPMRPDCRYPFKGLCATGVAFMFIAAVRRHLRERGVFRGRAEPDLKDLLDIVAVGTVADMVPIVDVNRVLVAKGLAQLGSGRRLGFQWLQRVAGIDPKRITATDIAFRIAPRINARGRLGHAKEAVSLLLTHDSEEAERLARQLDVMNLERREIERQTVAHAMVAIETQGLAAHSGLVVSDPTWHPGVLGLVASRLVAQFHRPAIVIGEGGKGSGRTFEDFHLYDAMAKASAHLIRFGGHRAAAGLTIAQEQVEAFRTHFTREAERRLGQPPFAATVQPDFEVPEEFVHLRTVSALERLAPFGQANPEPKWLLRGLLVHESRIVGTEHLKLRVGKSRHDAIAFGFGHLRPELPKTVDAICRMSRNEFAGRVTVQLEVEDLRPSAESISKERPS